GLKLNRPSENENSFQTACCLLRYFAREHTFVFGKTTDTAFGKIDGECLCLRIKPNCSQQR
ncbi:hypothetical protein ACTHRC_11500, partial [Neisseria sp. P0001.S009]|uniref:hypothetical protein n=1 Tax=Neisseria sp. P0001.S009 TaxID=3436653 RepID=UPI003F7DBA6E